MPKRESQKTEYKSSWQDEYFEWICGYANAKGGELHIGVNDDGYVVGLEDATYLLDVLSSQITDTMGIVVEIDCETVQELGTNIKYHTESLQKRHWMTLKLLPARPRMSHLR